MSKFKKLQGMLERKGYSKQYAGAVLANAGREKYGKKRFQHAAAEHKPVAKVKK